MSVVAPVEPLEEGSDADVAPAAPAVTRRRRAVSRVVAPLRDPLIRNAHTLTLGSAITALTGVAFWLVATHRYGTAAVGRNQAAISALTLLGRLGEINLISALIRFVPAAGRGVRRLVRASYLVSVACAGVMAVAFLAVVARFSFGLDFLVMSPWLALVFVAATMAWTVFELQDAVLTGLRRAPWVVADNGMFAIAKVGFVVVLAASLPGAGILVAWCAAIVVSLVLTNTYLFRRAIPFHERTAPSAVPISAGDIRRFVAVDYVGELCWQCVVSGVPVLIVALSGAKANAYFALPWVIANTLYLLSENMGQSLIVETATSQDNLGDRWHRVVSHTVKLLLAAVAFVVVAAPVILRVFGNAYSHEGTTLLRILAIAALPTCVTATAVSAARAQRRPVIGLVILAATCCLTLGVGTVLLLRWGIVGVGVAWLGSQTLIAAVLLLARRVWLPAPQADTLGSERPPVPRVDVASWWRVAARVAPRPERGTWSTSRAERAWREVLPDVRVALTRLPGEPVPRELRLRELVSSPEVDRVVLGTDDHPAALVAIARDGLAAARIVAQRDALRRLSRSKRAGEWREQAPDAVHYTNVARPFVVERWRPGTVGTRELRRRPDRLVDLVASAVDRSLTLQEATTRRLGLDEKWLRRHVDMPVSVLEHRCRHLSANSWRSHALVELRHRLRASLTASDVAVSWSHGDYTLVNLLYDDEYDVVGFTDWSAAAPFGLQGLDAATLLVTASATARGRELGHVVADALRSRRPGARPWPSELGPDVDRVMDAQQIDPDDAVLLAWLAHIVRNLQTSSRCRRSRVWLAANVDPVLRGVLS